VRIKICGITRLEDAELAVKAGAWAIGLNHWEGSSRHISVADAEPIGAAMKRRIELAGVFVNAPLGSIAAAVEREGLTIVQLHGDEGPAFCAEVARRTGARVIKAFRVRSTAEIRAAGAYRTDYHLFDAYRPGKPGGSGESFDWELLGARTAGIPAIVAGGLRPDNVAAAIAASRPWGVDVCGGVEERPGIKDPDLLERFVVAANRAGAEQEEERQRRRAHKRLRRAVRKAASS
jgi:phosphoribosylanthranilate isomerase